jgi:tetratricopeptide (TPR) repeat protein
MGEVYLAHDPQLQRRVAIKLLPEHLAANELARERLRREALAAASLDNPFICKVFEVAEDAGTIFIAMEYVRGETLFARLRAGRLPHADALRIAGEIAEALEEAHSAGIVHRDLKPANVMLTTQGRAKVMDFGLAKKLSGEVGTSTVTVTEPLTREGAIVGTPDYVSPEHLTGGPLDGRSDLFSFGIILCELLLGRHPFHRESALQTMAAILRDPPNLEATATADLSPGLMVLVRRLLAKSPDERYPSARELRSDLVGLSSATTAVAVTDQEAPVILVGRDAERDQLRRLLHGAIAGHGCLVLIGGEPGIGKTHLTRAILSEARKLGCFGVTGHCYEMEGSPPYIPFIETLEYCMRAAPPDTFRYSIGESAPEIAKLVPELRRRYHDIPPAIELPPEQQRRFLFNAYREFVERSARLTPIVVVLEDLHWADEATLQLLGHLAQTVSTIPVLLIGTYRDVDLDVTRPFARLLESWVRDKLATRLSLRRLGLAGVQTMLENLGGRTPPEWLAAVLHAETEGNPFFVEEVFQHLLEEGKLFTETGAWSTELRSGELQVPQGVRLVIGRRLERLREHTRRVLTTAAVVGRSFPVAVLEALEAGQPGDVLDAVEEAERAQLVEPDRAGRDVRYRFAHELVRQTIADSLSLPRRQRLHRRIADAMEAVAGGADTYAPAIAHHLYQAGAAADADKTVAYLIKAARLAAGGAAYEEALANADKALSLVEAGQHPLEPGLHMARATALRSMARFDEALQAYDSALERFVARGNVAGVAEAASQMAYIQLWRADGRRAVAVIDRALKFIGSQPSKALQHLQLLMAVSLSVIGDLEASIAALEAARKTGSALADPSESAFASMCEARVMFMSARTLELEQFAREAIRRFRAAGDLWGEAEVFDLTIARLWTHGTDDVQDLLRHAIALSERVGHRAALWAYKQFGAQLLMALGDLKGAGKALDEAHAIATGSGVGWAFVDFILSGAIAWYEGDLVEAELRVRTGIEMEPASYQSGELTAMLFLISAAKGDVDEDARKSARGLLPVPGRPMSLGACGCLPLLLEGLAITGQREEAAALQDVAEYAVENGPRCLYPLYLLRTAAGIAAAAACNWPKAEEHYFAAIQQADSAPYRTAQPIARLRYSEMLTARGMPGDHNRARGMLAEALNQFDAVGMRWYAERARESLAAIGPPP